MTCGWDGRRDLYDPDTMPGNLRKAHAALDTAVDKLYCTASFAPSRLRAFA